MFDPPAPPAPARHTGWAVPGVERQPVERDASAQVSAAVRVVQEAVRALAAVDLSGLSAEQVLVDTVAVLRESERLELLGVSLLAEVDHRHAYRLDGASSTARWVEGQGVPAGRGQVAVARRLGVFPLVDAAVLAGELSLAAAQKLQTALGRVRPHLDRPDGLIDGWDGEQVLGSTLLDGVRMCIAEARGGFVSYDDPVLVGLLRDLPAMLAGPGSQPGSQLSRVEAAYLLVAAHVEPAQLAGALALLNDALLPSAIEARAARGHERRRLVLRRSYDGSGWQLDGQLDAECGERVHAFLQAELHRDPDQPLDTALAAELRQQGLDPYDPELGSALTPRSTAERSHDALSNGLARYLDADLGGQHDKNPVQVLVTVQAETLDAHPGHQNGQDGPGRLCDGLSTGRGLDRGLGEGRSGCPESRPGGLPARGASGATLPISLVRRWACAAALTRLVLDLRGKVLETSHTERTLKPHERRALLTQSNGHCQSAGCRRSRQHPDVVLHPHHATPWSRSGTTSLTDSVLLCTHCHHDLHDGQHVLRLKDGRRLGPDGWVR